MIPVPVKVTARNYPQMSQMYTDEETHPCSSVSICEHLWITFWPKASRNDDQGRSNCRGDFSRPIVMLGA